MTANKSLLTVAPLFLVLFIDGMGLGLLFPILNSIIIDPHSAFLAMTVSNNMRNILFGLIIGIFMICWFFGAAVLGDLSDHIGRKKSLLICLLGAFLGYSLSALAIIIHSVNILILGRIIAGFTAGSQPIAQAAIVDVSTEEHKARNIGFILLAISLGFVLGPIIGGVLSDARIYSGFTYATPLYFAAVISLLNALLLLQFFRETFISTGKINLRLHHALYIFISAFRHPKIWQLSLVLLIMVFGWSNYFSFISMFLLEHYHMSTLQISLFLAVLGCGFSLGCGFFVDYCTKRFDAKKLITTTLLLAAIFILITMLIHSMVVAWAAAFVIGVCISVAYSVLLTLFSQQVGPQEQGWVMGVTGSIMALCFGLASLSTGFAANLGQNIPMGMAVVGLLASGIGMMFV